MVKFVSNIYAGRDGALLDDIVDCCRTNSQGMNLKSSKCDMAGAVNYCWNSEDIPCSRLLHPEPRGSRNISKRRRYHLTITGVTFFAVTRFNWIKKYFNDYYSSVANRHNTINFIN